MRTNWCVYTVLSEKVFNILITILIQSGIQYRVDYIYDIAHTHTSSARLPYTLYIHKHISHSTCTHESHTTHVPVTPTPRGVQSVSSALNRQIQHMPSGTHVPRLVRCVNATRKAHDVRVHMHGPPFRHALCAHLEVHVLPCLFKRWPLVASTECPRTLYISVCRGGQKAYLSHSEDTCFTLLLPQVRAAAPRQEPHCGRCLILPTGRFRQASSHP